MSLKPGVVHAVYVAPAPMGRDARFESEQREVLDLDWDGIPGDRHHNRIREACAREPWLTRGHPLRNDRQISALSTEEMAAIASGLDLPAVAPELLGANLIVSGIGDFSRLLPGTFLAIGGAWGGKGLFDGTAILRVEEYNRPCRGPARKLAAAHDRPDIEFGFVAVAKSLRGLVLSVAFPGVIRPGDAIAVVPPTVAP